MSNIRGITKLGSANIFLNIVIFILQHSNILNFILYMQFYIEKAFM